MVDDGRESPEHQVAELFRFGRHEVSQAAGDEPGTVDWFATLQTGLFRPKTYWRTLSLCPSDIEGALKALEKKRASTGADRAIAIVMEGEIPKGYEADLASSAVGVLTLRRFAFEITGVMDDLRKYVNSYEANEEDKLYLTRKVRDRPEGPDSTEAVTYIEHWIQTSDRAILSIVGPYGSGRATVIEHTQYVFAKRILDGSDAIPALLPLYRDGYPKMMYQRGWVIDVADFDTPLTRRLLRPYARIVTTDEGVETGLDDPVATVAYLDPPSKEDIERWYSSKLADAVIKERFLEARRKTAGLEELTSRISSIALWLAALTRSGKTMSPNETLSAWTARVLVDYMSSSLRDVKYNGAEFVTALEDGALEQFGLDRGFHVSDFVMSDVAEPWLSERTNNAERFQNPLIHHYFLARKIIREVQAGNLEVLTRYQFPRDYVLLFLAVLSPEVAAQLGSDQTAHMRAQIEDEVERRLQLTLAHMLKRSAGAARSQLKAIQRHLERTSPGEMAYELARIEEELAYQGALAEQTRLWHEVPEGEITGLVLQTHVEESLSELREKMPNVSCAVNVDPAIRVRASREGLREMLHGLFENAYHAALSLRDERPPAVRIEAQSEGDTTRLNVIDSGPGVAEADRERIFQLYQTTKKGGSDRPLGTGMGLPIARRYGERAGARVDLDPNHAETCFFIRFVTWRDVG